MCLSLVVPQPGCSMREEAERVEESDLSSETSAILNGNPADAGEYPWMAQIVVPGYTHQRMGGHRDER
ncbi:hypothetical protein [Cystobacter fuscus]|uniref:hypothetical protein n=1 Tax=Cystobacter fuscus TaxID=43 RepID=UPI0037BF0453